MTHTHKTHQMLWMDFATENTEIETNISDVLNFTGKAWMVKYSESVAIPYLLYS